MKKITFTFVALPVFGALALSLAACTQAESFLAQAKTPVSLELVPSQCGGSAQITCADVSSPLLNAGQSATIRFNTQTDLGTLIYTLVPVNAVSAPSDLGTATSTAEDAASYVAPASVPTSFDVNVYASTADRELCGYCPVHVVANNSLGIPSDPSVNAIVGNVYNIPPYTGPGGADPATNPNFVYTPPDLSALTPVLTVNLPMIHVPETAWSLGFPGYPNLIEWFAIRSLATLTVTEPGNYLFQTSSDDGSRLYIDGVLVVDNTQSGNNWHQAFTTITSRPIALSAGPHKFQDDWIQGPRYELGNVVSWQPPSATAPVPIPASAYSRP